MPEIIGLDLASGPDVTAVAIQMGGKVVYASTATEIMARADQFERRMAPFRASLERAAAGWLRQAIKTATRRKSKGWRRHVRRMKARR